MTEARPRGRGGLVYGLAAYGLWGVLPIYFKMLADVPPLEVLAHRVVWCLVVLVAVLLAVGRLGDFARCLGTWRTMRLLGISTVLIAANWFAFIYGVANNRIKEASLGYFVTPLLNVLFGRVFYGERLRRGQAAALALGAAGLGVLVWQAGQVPWIALVLAGSFGLYGLVRKVAPVGSLLGLSVETLLLAPVAAAGLVVWEVIHGGAFGGGAGVATLLVLTGPLTALPLLWFGKAARRLPLTTLGFLQYLSPSMQFALAVGVYGEPFTTDDGLGYGLVWAALAVASAEALWTQRTPRHNVA